MHEINFNELTGIKIMPYEIDDELGNPLVKAGETITPGKLLALKNKKLFKASNPFEKRNKAVNFIDDTYFIFSQSEQESIISDFCQLIEKIKSSTEDDIKNSATDIINKIYATIIENYKKADFLSQFRLFGDYIYAHSINCTILSCIVAIKQNINQQTTSNIMQAALLHDVAKIITKDFTSIKTRKNHSIAACKILSRINYEYEILNIILNHHENLDGSGYPKNKYFDKIPKEAMIINICSFFDNLFRFKEIKSYKDAFRAILKTRHSKFSLDILYTLVNSYNYGDIRSFEGIYE